MKKYIAVLIIHFLFSHLQAQIASQVWHKDSVKIKRIKTVLYNAEEKNGQFLKTTVKQAQQISYDSLGRMQQKAEEIGANGTISTFKYNELGLLTQEIVKLSASGKAYKTTSKLYDGRKNLIADDLSIENQLFAHVEYNYDTLNRKTEYIYYDKMGKRDTKISYVYNSFGKISQYWDYDSDGKVRRRIVFLYDNQGNLTEEQAFWNNDKLYAQTKYQNNRIVEQLVFTSNLSENNRITNRYDAEGNLVESVYYDPKCATSTVILKYSFKKEYDKNRNWVKETAWKNGKIHTITERFIEYF
ncbi:MAG: hypothetical protein RL757_106 [Bacteroidota bacterium]|jgi:uncharacterized protein YbjQ (UPF0145 family)